MLAIGVAYLAKGDCQKSLEQLLAAMHLHQNIYTEKELARAYLCVGQLDSAEHYYKRVAEGTSGTTQSEANTRLGEIYAQQGKHALAYQTLRASLDFREKHFNVQKVQEIGAAKAELELELAHHRLAEEEQQRKNSRLRNILVALSLLMVLVLSFGLYFQQRSRRRILEQENQLLAQQKELALARETLKAQELEQSQSQLEVAQQELDATAKLLNLKTQLIEVLEMKLREKQSKDVPFDSSSQNVVNGLQDMKILTNEDWAFFRQQFRESFPGFLETLKKTYPKLTLAETRLFLLLKLNFNSKEIADTLGISPQSVWRSRHRLSKKLGLLETGDLDRFIEKFLSND